MSIRWHEFNPQVLETAGSQPAALGNELIRITATPGMTSRDIVRIFVSERAHQSVTWIAHMLNAYTLILLLKMARRQGRSALVASLVPQIRPAWDRFIVELDALVESRPSSPTSVADIMLEST